MIDGRQYAATLPTRQEARDWERIVQDLADQTWFHEVNLDRLPAADTRTTKAPATDAAVSAG